MLIIQHRTNDISPPAISKYGEIDVHMNVNGTFDVRHDICEPGWKLDFFLEKSKHDKFFVDIKQNLKVSDYQRMIDRFGDRLIGLFDVPFPSSFFAVKEGLPIYLRASEYEMPYNLTNKFWIDPLRSQTVQKHSKLFNRIRDMCEHPKIIFACPSLHQKSLDESRKLWAWIRNMSHLDKRFIQGIVTKHVSACEEVVGENI